MPRVAEFNGILVSIYAADHNPPHVHAYYGDYSALLEIATGNVIAGELPGKQLRLAQRWLADNRDRMVEMWNTMNP